MSAGSRLIETYSYLNKQIGSPGFLSGKTVLYPICLSICFFSQFLESILNNI